MTSPRAALGPHTSVETAAEISVASVASTCLWYPYRDFVKAWSWPPHLPPVSFATARYLGLAQNPGQVAVLSSGPVALFTSFDLVGGGATGAVCGGLAHATWKTSMRMLSSRMKQQKRNGDPVYAGLADCIRTCTKASGIWSWFPGLMLTGVISMSWHGAALVALSHNQRGASGAHHTRGRRLGGGGAPGTFVGDWWSAFRVHAFLAFVTCPLRNTCRSSLYASERSGGVRTFQAWMAGEHAILKEAMGVAPSMIKTQGISFFLHGSMKTTFKSSVPFGFTFALFRAMNGQLG